MFGNRKTNLLPPTSIEFRPGLSVKFKFLIHRYLEMLYRFGFEISTAFNRRQWVGCESRLCQQVRSRVWLATSQGSRVDLTSGINWSRVVVGITSCASPFVRKDGVVHGVNDKHHIKKKKIHKIRSRHADYERTKKKSRNKTVFFLVTTEPALAAYSATEHNILRVFKDQSCSKCSKTPDNLEECFENDWHRMTWKHTWHLRA